MIEYILTTLGFLALFTWLIFLFIIGEMPTHQDSTKKERIATVVIAIIVVIVSAWLWWF